MQSLRTRVKICGITRPEDVDAAVRVGADALGFVFYPRSRRWLEPEQAGALARGLPPFVARVALFLSPETDLVLGVLDKLQPDCLQFHGDETPEFCAAFARPYIKAVPMAVHTDLGAWSERFAPAAGLLLDSHVLGEAGGSGKAFDWSSVKGRNGVKPLILAGGLDANNVEEAIQRVQPYAVDVSSGVESAPGLKDPALMAAFMRGVNRADSSRNAG